MIPVVTPEQMRRVDERAVASGVPLDTLIDRAGWAVAVAARRMLGGTYGRRVVVIAGPGNNGADGRVAGRLLADRGVHVVVLATDDLPAILPDADLVIDAAFGTGFRGVWNPPPSPAPVLAVDVPSGVDGLTGAAHGSPWRCERTVTFAAPKPGLYVGEGRTLSGAVDIADIGLEIRPDDSTIGIVTADDVASQWPRRGSDAHKWKHGALVVAGSPGMLGAAGLATTAAMRAGAGIVHLVTPGSTSDRSVPTEVVRLAIPLVGWSNDVLEAAARRFRVVAIGPGLGRDDAILSEARRVIGGAPVPVVVDGDALYAIDAETVSRRPAPTILTPHDGEFAVLTGSPPGVDRLAATLDVARRFQAVVLLKGPTTVVAEPSGRVALVTHGDQRLATAGSGDVLTGVITGAVASGVAPFEAAALAAWVCADAGRRSSRHGTMASDLVGALPAVFDVVLGPNGQNDPR